MHFLPFSYEHFCDPVFLILTGVRYFIRGVDDDGHVANYVETEQVMIYNGYRASFVQVITVVIHSCMVVYELGFCTSP